MPMPDPIVRPAQLPLVKIRPALAVPQGPPVSLRPLRFLLGLYIALWIFEGALRKWIVPGLANPLLIIRDPVLLLLYMLAVAKGVFPTRPMVFWIITLGAVAFGVSFAGSDIPLVIQLYGLRADYLHLPLIFLMPMIFDRDDIRQVGKWLLLIGGPMAVLVLLQFLSSGSGFLNRGAGGSDSGQLESAYGHVRPSGTFSFTNGLTGFTAIVVAFFLHNLLEKRVYPKWLWLAAGPALAVLIVLSGSRVAVGLAGLIMASVVFICVLKPRYWRAALSLFVLGALAFIALGSFAVFRSGMDVFAYRFGSSSNVQSGFFGRFLDSMTAPYQMLADVPANGVGLGMGTNVAGALLTGKRTFLVAEGEWPRVLIESGAYVGTAFILLRGVIVCILGLSALRSLRQHANTLPMLVLAGCFIDVLQGQFAQPTGLGYAVIGGGLSLAACRVPVAPVVAAPDIKPASPPVRGMGPGRLQPTRAPELAVPTPEVVQQPAESIPERRGRSIYAERLHQASENNGQ